MQILFIQGAGDGTHEEWDDKLVASLRANGATVHYPQMPDEGDPKRARWVPAIREQLAALDDGAIVVGHSVGGTLLLHALTTPPPVRLAAIVLLAAPFLGDGGWPTDEPLLDPRALPDVPVLLYHGSDDSEVPVAHAHRYAKLLANATLHVLPGRDHQLGNDLTIVVADLRRATGSDR